MQLKGLALPLVLTGKVKGDVTGWNTSCCEGLSAELPLIHHGPSSPDYNQLISARWSGTAILRPACVITPRTPLDISTAIKFLVKGQCKFAVKSGGHNANPGANSIEGGVSIDLGRLNTVSLAHDRSHVSLGSGATWGQAYDTLNNSNIGFPGGVCGEVGVGGPSMGGGQSVFQASKGWIVDNVLNYEIVLASGHVVNANETSYQDLFKALKGGNTNFGIVTRVDVAAFDFEGLWVGANKVSLNGPQASRPEMLDRISYAMVDFVRRNNVERETEVQLLISYLSGNKGQLVDFGLTNTDNMANPPAAQNFLNIPHRLSYVASHTNMAVYAHQNTQLLPRGFREANAGLTIMNDFKTVREIWDACDKIYNSLSHKDQIDWIIQLLPQPKVQQSYAEKRGGNSLGLSDMGKDQIVIWFMPRWKDPSLDIMMAEAQKRFIKDTEAIAKKHGTYSPFVYISYAGPTQNPLCGYGRGSASFLEQVAKKYDPYGVFQRLMRGGFKISQADCG